MKEGYRFNAEAAGSSTAALTATPVNADVEISGQIGVMFEVNVTFPNPATSDLIIKTYRSMDGTNFETTHYETATITALADAVYRMFYYVEKAVKARCQVYMSGAATTANVVVTSRKYKLEQTG
uniref:Uncharacterized protein n=1 Tax=viral metagenome TaxID=1070528 RepID=A0A6H1ZEU4_9ZZZZ